MVVLFGIVLFVALAWPWLLGSWVMATMFSIAFALPGLMLAVQNGYGLAATCIIFGLIWTPHYFRRRRPGLRLPTVQAAVRLG